MRHLWLGLITLALIIPADRVHAQNGADIMRGVFDFAVGEIERQQRQKQQQRAYRRQHQQFTAAWQACFADNLAACNQALLYRQVHRNDRARLKAKRSHILAARAAAKEAARYENQRRQAAAARRLAAERAEAERLRRLREAEEQRLANLRAYQQYHSACLKHDAAACRHALNSSLATTEDAAVLQRPLADIKSYQLNRRNCKGGSRTACTNALASPALPRADKEQLANWHAATHPMNQAMAAMTNVPASTAITGLLALLLAVALCLVMLQPRATAESTGADDEAETVAPAESLTHRWHMWIQPVQKFLARWQSAKREDEEDENEPEPTAEPEPPAPRDTPGAIAALELAEAYIEEVRETARPAHDDKPARREQLNTLSLAAKQLTVAEALDPDAELVVTSDQGEMTFTIGALKAKALILEARTYDDHDTGRALPPLRQATEIDPTNATAFFLLGSIEAANMNRARAISALQTAVDLEPDNLTFRKELNRAESISAAEAAAFKTTRLGERVYDTGITAWNVFAMVWNILTFPFRVLSHIMRLFVRV